MDANHQDTASNNQATTGDVEWVLSKKSKLIIPQHKNRTKKTFKIPFDWLNLIGVLLIPFVVTVIGLYATQQITFQQNQFTQQQAKLSDAANRQQHQTDLQIAMDQQEQTTLQTYLDHMTDLLMNHNLLRSKPEDEVRSIAESNTLTTLRQLDGKRKALVILFLYRAHLIDVPFGPADHNNPIISLAGANLSQIDFSSEIAMHNYPKGIHVFVLAKDPFVINLLFDRFCGKETNSLQFIDLSKTNLSGANLTCVDLSGADLSEANLNQAYLQLSLLIYTNLKGDNLGDATFNAVLLFHANLEGVSFCASNNVVGLSNCTILDYSNLQGANLKSSDFNYDRNTKGVVLQGATMPDGSIHP